MRKIHTRSIVPGLLGLLLVAHVAVSAQVGGGGATPEPGDRVFVRVWDEPEMTDTFTVTESREVTLPRLGTVPVGGQRIETLQDSLRNAYAEFLRNPSVEVRVLRRVAAVGEVKQPGVYWVDLTVNVADLIARAGGLTEAGNPNSIDLIRGEQRTRFRRGERELLMSTPLRSGDQVAVNQRNFFARNPLAAVSSAITIVGYVVTVIIPALR